MFVCLLFVSLGVCLDRIRSSPGGNISVWAICLLFQAAGQPLEKVMGASSIFAVASRVEILPAFYEEEPTCGPIKATDRVIHVGKTSQQRVIEIRSLYTGKLLHYTVGLFVHVDPVTRRPTPVPKNIRAFTGYQKYFIPRTKARDIPPNAYVTSVRVQMSDIDRNGHMNQSHYIRVCHDAMCDAASSGFLSRMKGDLAKHRIKSVASLHQGEAKAGDALLISTWVERGEPLIIHTAVKRQQTDIMQCTMEFQKEINSHL